MRDSRTLILIPAASAGVMLGVQQPQALLCGQQARVCESHGGGCVACLLKSMLLSPLQEVLFWLP